jgi:hypothetical protein
LELRLGRARRVVFTVRDAAGRPPPRRPSCVVADAVASPPTYDAATGALALTILPLTPDGDRFAAAIVAPGFGYWASALRLVGDVDAPLCCDAPLSAAGSVRVKVRPPADGRFLLVADTRLDARGGAARRLRRLDAENFVLDDAPPGPVRIRDALSGATTSWRTETEFLLGAPPVLDLSQSGDVVGELVAPEGGGLRGARVRRRFADDPDADSWHEIGADGAFRIRVPGDRDVLLEARHPRLVPAGGVAARRVRAPETGLRIALVEGPVLSMRLVPGPFAAGENTAALFFARDGAPAAEHRRAALRPDGVVRFGGYLAGTYDVFLDHATRAPVFLRGIVLDDEDRDLGDVELPAGGACRVRAEPPRGEHDPLVVHAWSLGVPAYRREGVRADDGSFLIRGLGVGKFRVQVSTVPGATRPRFGRAEFAGDGRATETLTIPLR